jgi:protocatechuate 3,4-dioxygenase beta subunit
MLVLLRTPSPLRPRAGAAAALFLLLVVLAAPAAPAQEVSVDGRVLGPEGDPLPEALVTLLPRLGAVERQRLADAGEAPEPVSTGRSDAAGRYRLFAPHAGLWTVRVEAPGFVPLELGLEPLLDARDLPDATLMEDLGLELRALDAEGAAVAGARVRLSRLEYFGGSERWRPPTRSALTDAEGRARLARAEGEPLSLSASAPGFRPLELLSVRGTALSLELERGPSLTLALRDAGDTPVAGALVSLGERFHPAGFTDEAGLFSTALPRTGDLPVRLTAADGRLVEGRIAAASTAGASEEVSKREEARAFVLPDLLELAGRVLDAESRRPVVGAVVWAEGSGTEATFTGSGGRYSLAVAERPLVLVQAGAPGYLRSDMQEYAPGVDLGRGPSLALKPGAVIEGRVLDGEGQPVSQAELSLEVKQVATMRISIRGDARPLPTARSDERGRFRLGPVSAEESYDLRARAEGFAPGTEELVGLEPYETRGDVRVVLEPGRLAVGRVLDPQGRPLRDCTATLKAAPAGGHMSFGRGGGEASYSATSDAAGLFEIADLPAGRFDLELRRPGFARRSAQGIEVGDEAERQDLGEFTLEPGVSVAGLVLDESGQPIEGVEVDLPSASGFSFSFGPSPAKEPRAVTGPDGRFLVEELARDEKITLSLSRRGYVSVERAGLVPPLPEPLTVTMTPSSRVVGRVASAGEEEPIPGATVTLTRTVSRSMGGRTMMAMTASRETTDGEGVFVFEGLEPGPVSLKASGAGWQEAEMKDLEVPQGEDLEGVELPLEPGAVVVGKVTGPDGRPAIGASVRVVGEEKGPFVMFGGGADAEGRYRLEGVTPGEVSIEATYQDSLRVVKDIEAEPGVNTLDLRFEGGRQVSGRVSDQSGAAVPGALVTLAAPGRPWGGQEVLSGLDGAFEFTGVPDGDHALTAERQGYAPSEEQRVSVQGGPVDGLELRLSEGAAIVGRVLGLEPEELARVEVSGFHTGRRGMASARVGADGAYRLENLAEGGWELRAEMDEGSRMARGQTTLEPGALETSLDLEFRQGVVLSGEALRADRPVGNADVVAEGLDVSHYGWGRTELDGSFRVEGLEPGRYRVSLREWKTGLSYSEEVELTSSRSIVLEVPTARISGRVVDGTDREPVAGATLTLAAVEDEETPPFLLPGATTDLEGRFSLRDVADGTWRLTCSKKGYAAEVTLVDVQSGRDRDDLSIALDPTEGLTLEVRLPDGRVAGEVRAAVLDSSGRALLSGTYGTGENGRVRLSAVPPGTWELVLGAPGAASLAEPVSAPGGPLPITLPPPCALRVSVPELAGETVRATATLAGGDGRIYRELSWFGTPQSEWRVSGGLLALDAVPPGSWTVRVEAADGRAWSGVVTARPEAPAELLLE